MTEKDRTWLPLSLREATKSLSGKDRAVVQGWYWRTSDQLEECLTKLAKVRGVLDGIEYGGRE